MADLLCIALGIYRFILFARILLSYVTMMWSPPAALTPVIRVIYDLTEPVLSFFRKFIPPLGGFDLSPLVVFLIIWVAQGHVC
jgi:YggT family protein